MTTSATQIFKNILDNDGDAYIEDADIHVVEALEDLEKLKEVAKRIKDPELTVLINKLTR